MARALSRSKDDPGSFSNADLFPAASVSPNRLRANCKFGVCNASFEAAMNSLCAATAYLEVMGE